MWSLYPHIPLHYFFVHQNNPLQSLVSVLSPPSLFNHHKNLIPQKILSTYLVAVNSPFLSAFLSLETPPFSIYCGACCTVLFFCNTYLQGRKPYMDSPLHHVIQSTLMISCRQNTIFLIFMLCISNHPILLHCFPNPLLFI